MTSKGRTVEVRRAGNLAQINHLTGTVMAGDMLTKTGGFPKDEIRAVHTAIVAHSTG